MDTDSRKYKVVVVDDDGIAISELEKALSKHKEFEILATGNNAEKGKELLFAHRPDLLFLDVELPDMQGLDLLNSIKEDIGWDLCVVFYSMHNSYVLPAMRESAFDFLLKPFEQQELDGIIGRFYKDWLPSLGNRVKKAEEKKLPVLKDTFFASTVNGYQAMRLSDIGYFSRQGVRRQWRVCLAGGTSVFLKRGTNAEMILGYSPAFVQISQSCVINVNYLAMICGNECRLYPPFDNIGGLAISRNCLKRLQELIEIV